MKEVTVIITSCNRFDLLEKTIDSFLELNTYPIKSWHLHNDSGPVPDKLKLKYPFINIIYSSPRIGYSKSIDKLLKLVDTEYVWTTEDDWHYYKNPGFIEKSIQLLEAFPKTLHQIWIRDINDHNHKQSIAYEKLPGLWVHDVMPGYKKVWHGFSLNPGLRRMSDWKQWFPNGLAEFGDEAVISQHLSRHYKAVSLFESSIKHLGWGRRSINFRA